MITPRLLSLLGAVAREIPAVLVSAAIVASGFALFFGSFS